MNKCVLTVLLDVSLDCDEGGSTNVRGMGQSSASETNKNNLPVYCLCIVD